MTHAKVARCILNPQNGKEIILSLNDGGEVQLWEKKIWEQYHNYIQQNPQVRGTTHYPWTFIEWLSPPNDISNIKLLPEKTGGIEFQININAKN
jgi:hypothetical protein